MHGRDRHATSSLVIAVRCAVLIPIVFSR
jgi:hypothetical protein